MPDDVKSIGHNSGGPDLDILRDQLAIDYADDIARRDELLAGFDRFKAKYSKIEDDDVNGNAADFVAQLSRFSREIDAKRVAAKRPHDDAASAVHAFFKKGIIDTIDAAAASVKKVMTDYQVAKAEAARRKAREEAEAKRLEAERLAAEARKPEEFDQAEAALNAAQTAERRASAPTSALGRTRGDLGSVSSLRSVWRYRVLDITKVPVHLLEVNADMVQAAMRTKGDDGKPAPIEGIEFYEEKTVAVR